MLNKILGKALRQTTPSTSPDFRENQRTKERGGLRDVHDPSVGQPGTQSTQPKCFPWAKLIPGRAKPRAVRGGSMALDTDANQVGNKAANLATLATVAADANVGAAVPAYLGLSHAAVWRHIQATAPQTFSLWRQFVQAQGSERRVVTPAAASILQALRAQISEAFMATRFADADAWIQAHGDASLMVRSTGREDSNTVVNAGGNESIANVQGTPEAVSKAMGQVVASYFSERSLSQRLHAGDDITAPPFVPVLLQRMIGEGATDAIPPSSGVMFTREAEGRTPGVVHIQAAFGHNEGVVTGKVAPDNYFVLDGVTHEVHAIKAERMRPSLAGQLEMVDNAPSLRCAPALCADVVTRLSVLARHLEAYHRAPRDVEFTYDPQTDVIYLLQSRPLGETQRPAATHIDAGAARGMPRVQGTVIGSAGGSVRTIEGPDQLLQHDTLKGALDVYLAEPNPGIRAVVVRELAPSTSHEATTFRCLNIPVVQVDHAPNWLHGPAPVLIDTQTGALIQVASAAAGAAIIRDGWRHHPIAARSSVGAKDKPGLSEAADLVLQLLQQGWPHGGADAATGVAERLAALQRHATPAVEASLLQGSDGGSTLTKLLDVAETDSDPQRVARALALLLRHALQSAQLCANRNPQLRNDAQALVSQIVGDMAGVLTARRSSQPMQQLYALRWLRVALTQTPHSDVVDSESLVSLMARAKALTTARQTLGDAGEAVLVRAHLIPYLASYQALGKTAQRSDTSAAWNEFTRALVRSGNGAANQVLARIVAQMQEHGAGALWLNTAFAEAWERAVDRPHVAQRAAACLQALQRDVEQPNTRSFMRWARSSTRVARAWERRAADFAAPGTFEATWSRFKQEFVTMLDGLVPQLQDASGLGRMVALTTMQRHIEVYDHCIKSLTGSPQYAAAKAEQVARFAAMLGPYKDVAGHLAKALLPTGLRGKVADPLDTLLEQVDAIYDAVASSRSDLQLRPSESFNVACATVVSAGQFNRFAPGTLEDLFTLSHQNSLAALSYGLMEAGLNTERLHPAVGGLTRRLAALDLPNTSGVLVSTNHPNLVGVQLEHPDVVVRFNIPLRNHGAAVAVRGTLGDDGALLQLKVECDAFCDGVVIEVPDRVAEFASLHAQLSGHDFHFENHLKSVTLHWSFAPDEVKQAWDTIPKLLEQISLLLYGEQTISDLTGLYSRMQEVFGYDAQQLRTRALPWEFFARHASNNWSKDVVGSINEIPWHQARLRTGSLNDLGESLQFLASTTRDVDTMAVGHAAMVKLLSSDSFRARPALPWCAAWGVSDAEKLKIAQQGLADIGKLGFHEAGLARDAISRAQILAGGSLKPDPELLLRAMGVVKLDEQAVETWSLIFRTSTAEARAGVRKERYQQRRDSAVEWAVLASTAGASRTSLLEALNRLVGEESTPEIRLRFEASMLRAVRAGRLKGVTLADVAQLVRAGSDEDHAQPSF